MRTEDWEKLPLIVRGAVFLFIMLAPVWACLPF